MTKDERTSRLAIAIPVAAVLSAVAVTLAVTSQRPKNFAVVDDGFLYRSGQIQHNLIRGVLEDHQIGVVINLGEDKDKRDHVAEMDAARDLGIERHTFYLYGDGTGEIERYAEAIEVMHRAKRQDKRILVHCSAGAQRTTAAVAFYQMLVEGKTPADAMAHAEQFHCPIDNEKLLPYMNRNMATLARMLVERGVIDRVPDPIPVLHP